MLKAKDGKILEKNIDQKVKDVLGWMDLNDFRDYGEWKIVRSIGNY